MLECTQYQPLVYMTGSPLAMVTPRWRFRNISLDQLVLLGCSATAASSVHRQTPVELRPLYASLLAETQGSHRLHAYQVFEHHAGMVPSFCAKVTEWGTEMASRGEGNKSTLIVSHASPVHRPFGTRLAQGQSIVLFSKSTRSLLLSSKRQHNTSTIVLKTHPRSQVVCFTHIKTCNKPHETDFDPATCPLSLRGSQVSNQCSDLHISRHVLAMLLLPCIG